jgi:hypothetical protein
MALTGTLLADFSAFVNEASKATNAVKGLEKGGDDAAAKLAKFGENFNLKDALNNPLSTATDLLKEFGGSLGTVGVAAIAAGAGVAALGTALFSLGVYSADAIARFDDLADKTGMSVPALSRLSHAANVVGADLTQLTDVVFKLERGMGENTPAFQAGLAAMGLSTAQLRAAGPDQYLELVTEGLKGMADPAARAAAGSAVLGKGYRDVAAALNDLGEGLKLTADIPAFTAQQAADAERFLFQLASLKEHVLALGVAIGSDLIGPLSTMVEWLGKLKGAYDSLPSALKNVLSPVNAAKFALSEASAAVEVFTGKTGDLPAVAAPAGRSIDQLAASMKGLANAAPTVDAAFKAQKEVIDGTKEWEKAIAEIQAALGGWQAQLATVEPALAEQATLALAAGVSQGKVATAYHLSADQVKALSIALDENSTAMNNNADFAIAAEKRRKEITAAMTKATNDAILAQFEKQTATEKADAAFLEGALKDALAEDEKQRKIHETTGVVQAGAETIGGANETAMQRSVAAFEQFKGVVVAGTGTIVQNLTAITDAGSALEQRRQLYEAQMARGGFFINTGGAPPPIQTRDSGGPVSAGTPYLIGGGIEPEIFVPGANGFVTPGGGRGGAGVQVTNVFHIVDTEANLARRVSAQITRSIMTAQKL